MANGKGDRIWLVLCTTTGVAVDVTLNKYATVLPGWAVLGLWVIPLILFVVWFWRVERTAAWVKDRFLEHPVSYVLMFLILIPFGWQATRTMWTKIGAVPATHVESVRPALPEPTPTQPNSSALSLPTGQQIVNAPNGIGNIGGTLVNPTVNNYGPPDPKIEWSVVKTLPSKQVVLRVKFDRLPQIPAFAALCDNPCQSGGAYNNWSGNTYVDDSVNYRAVDPKVSLVLLTPHEPLSPARAISWLITATTDAPIKILKVELLPPETASKFTVPEGHP